MACKCDVSSFDVLWNVVKLQDVEKIAMNKKYEKKGETGI